LLTSSAACQKNLAVNNFDLQNSLFIYPNPSNGTFSINFKNLEHENFNLTVLDMLGKRIKIINNISIKDSKIDLSELSNGTYLLKINSQEKHFTETIIIKK
jgi:hypothetical protein